MGKNKNKKGSGDDPNQNKPQASGSGNQPKGQPQQQGGKDGGKGQQQGGAQRQGGGDGRNQQNAPQQQGGAQRQGGGDGRNQQSAPQQQGARGGAQRQSGGDGRSQQSAPQQQGGAQRQGGSNQQNAPQQQGAWGGSQGQSGGGGRGGFSGESGGGGRGGGQGGRGGGQGGRGGYSGESGKGGDGGGRGGGQGGRGGFSGESGRGGDGGGRGGGQGGRGGYSGDGGRGGHGGGRGGEGGGRGGHGGRGGFGGEGGRGGGQGGRGGYSGESGRGGDGGGRGGGQGGRGGYSGDGGRGGYGGGRGGEGGGRGRYGDRGGFGGDNGGGKGGFGDRGGGGGGGAGGGGGGGGSRSTAVVRVPKPQTSIQPRGTRGQNFEVETNYLMLDLDKMPDVAYHYDVKIDPDRPKKFMRPAFDAYVQKILPKYNLAYDGKANAYSPVLLPHDKIGSEVTVEVPERDRKVPFKVTLKATEDVEIDLKSLKNYHKERIFDKPMRALQCLEVVISTPCHDIGVRAGRSFFKEPRNRIDLGDGFELWYGLYQAAMLCDQPLLNVDVSHKSFPSRVNLVDFYQKMRNPRELTDFLKGLRLTYKPPQCFKGVDKEYKFVKVMDSASKQTFTPDDGKKCTIEEYFRSKGYRLQHPNLPCLHVGSTMKNIYIPLELLEVPPGQAIMRKDNENQVRQMIRHAATSTDIRKDKIYDLLESFNYYMHPTVQRFGVSVGKSFITVDARLLRAPTIEYCQGRNIVIDRPGEWMNKGLRFYKCDRNIHQWAILNISQKSDINEMFLREHFVEKIVKESQKLGMNLDSKCFCIKEAGRNTRGPIDILEDLRKLKSSKISIVFVILPFHAESYARVKQQAELSCGIVTQCIKGDTIRSYNKRFNCDKIIDQMTIGNILLKVNAKLNGTNHRISPQNEITLQKSKVMFVGADVSHPSPLQMNLPSIVGVVASHDLLGTQYNMQYRLQAAKLETIDDMENIMTQHLNVFKSFNGNPPDHIIYYRDGVSDGQFELIKKIEVNAMRAACKKMKCAAKFTVVIVVKRHHTRFFPKGNDGEGKFNNVRAGTVVDQTICHPNETQFFMVSHKAIQGTSKPTRYNVIIDDAKINIDDLQALTYNLCHLFPRCNRSVSYPAPAYLAHLVGLRGRAYIEGSNLNLENLKVEYNKRTVSNDIMKFNPMYFV